MNPVSTTAAPTTTTTAAAAAALITASFSTIAHDVVEAHVQVSRTTRCSSTAKEPTGSTGTSLPSVVLALTGQARALSATWTSGRVERGSGRVIPQVVAGEGHAGCETGGRKGRLPLLLEAGIPRL
jgi:hypothetical protein